MNYNTAVGIVVLLVLLVGASAIFLEYRDYEVGPEPQVWPGKAIMFPEEYKMTQEIETEMVVQEDEPQLETTI